MSTTEIDVTPGAQEDRTVAILSYITVIGFIIAVVLHSSKKTALGAFHLRQALGLLISFTVIWVALMIVAVIPIIGLITIPLFPLVGLAVFVLAIMGLIAAANGKHTPVPVVGAHFQKWFATTFE